ncbi:ubiquitin carboxyl-terminal hydrolase 2-like isoform X2 [Physella acuta]|uniref:ubiquitin carboxyl-terminal hydrolase 2-like isoform X2 n=1 Tax=Physella acuta TaxID=109671 RepID=UPI0027DE6826|nr:ubiquitin carboxyl-terminal hydrolase 2-like isoform X2 [Physella acuta]
MPVSSAAYDSYRHGFNTTYSTSYGSSSTSVPRVSSTGRKTSLTNGYTSTTTSYRTRPLPSGPGPLDSSGRKLSSFNVPSYESRRNRTPTGVTMRNGPLKADHTTLGTSNRFLTDTAPSSRTTYRDHSITRDYTSSRDSSIIRPLPAKRPDGILGDLTLSRPPSGSNRPRKTSSLINLSSLNLDSDVNTSSNRNRGTSVFNDRVTSNSSSRNSSYRDDVLTQTSHLDRSRGEASSRSRYTPSRESSPSSGSRYVKVTVDHNEYPSKSTLSNQSSSSSMSNGSVKHREGGKVGLKNLGNTCFMNSVLQCLSNTRMLLEWCLDDKYKKEINTTTSNMKGSLVTAYANLMQSMWKEKGDTGGVSPNAFKTQIQKFAPRFMGYAQQDSQEFLRYLLEGLHEDVNRVTKKPAPIILDDGQLEKKVDSGKAKDYWNAYLNRDDSMIVDIFVGQLKSELKFSSCGHRSVTFDPFWDLSVSIPKNRHELNLEDCIKLFMKEEELAAEERPMCTKCKRRQSCTKSFSIQRFPKILVLHLKRFSQERFGRKLTTQVDFPTEGLDLTEFAAEGVSGGRILYDLYAVSNHSGGTSSGHYTAYCKNPYSNEWHYFNDSRVTSARSNEAVSSEAYVLFYKLMK